MPRGFVPAADQGYVIALVQLPSGSSLQRTDEIVREVGARSRADPRRELRAHVPGPQSCDRHAELERRRRLRAVRGVREAQGQAKSSNAIQAEINKRVADISGAQITVIAPPTIRGIGASGGFSLRVQDMNNRGPVALEQATQDLLKALMADPRIMYAFTPFGANAPEFFVDVDRTKAEMLGVPVQRVHETLEGYLGSAYVNDFNLSGRTYQVIAQAEGLSRLDVEQIGRLKAKSETGAMVPLASVADVPARRAAPDRVPRYNLFPTAEIIGAALPGGQLRRRSESRRGDRGQDACRMASPPSGQSSPISSASPAAASSSSC